MNKMLLMLCLCWTFSAGAQERVARVGFLSWQDSGAYNDTTLPSSMRRCALPARRRSTRPRGRLARSD